MDGVNNVGRSVPPGQRGKADSGPDPMQVLGAFLTALSNFPEAPTSTSRIASTRDSGANAPAGSGTTAPATPASSSSNEVAAAFLARPVYTFDRSRVSTAMETLGENRGNTDSQLILEKNDPARAGDTVRQELGRQASAEQDSTQRAERAREALETQRGREQQLNAQRDELGTFKAARQNDVLESERQVQSDTARIEQQTAAIQSAQNEGESSRSRIDQLDGQAQQAAQARDQASSDVSSGQQQVQSLQNQVSTLQQQAQQDPPGNSGQGSENGKAPGKGPAPTANGAAPPKNSGWALAQQQLQSTQSQLTNAQQQVEDAKRRQQQSEESLKSSQQAANSERQRLEGIRGDIDQRVQTRRTSQDRAQSNKQQMQQDLDALKDLGSHKQDLDSQADEIASNKAQARISLERNQANADAARANAAQLQNLERQFRGEENQEARRTDPSSGSSIERVSNGSRGSDRAFDPLIDSTLESAEGRGRTSADGPRQTTASPGQNSDGPRVQQQGERTVVSLRSLNQGINGASQDTSGGLAKHRGKVGEDGDLGDASVAAAAAAVAASDSANRAADSSSGGPGRGNSGPGSGPPGLDKKGGEPPGQSKKGRG